MPERTRLDVVYDQQVFAVRKQLLAQSKAFWNGLGSYRDADFERLVEVLVPRIESGQKKVSNLTASYLSQVLKEEAGLRRGELPSSTPVSTQDLRGVSAEEVYHRPFASTYTALDDGKGFTAAQAAGLERLLSIVSTGIQLSKTHTSQRVLGRNGQKMYQRVLTGRENCALCTIAATQRYWVKDLMPIHPGCVPGDSVISPVSGGSSELAEFAWGEVQAISRRLFKGELVEFVTTSGNQVRVTPNHPVLTDKGWIPAHLLCEGSAVFRTASRQRVVDGGPNVGERPALAQDVFDAARMAFPLVRMPLAAEDFHADGANGEVEIVYTDGNFPTPRNPSLIQEVSELGLVDTHGGRFSLDSGSPFCTLFPGRFSPPGGVVGCGGLGSDLFGGHLGGSKLASVTAPTRFDAPAEKFSLESAPVYASQGMNLKRRLSREVDLDRIVKLRRVSWSGHVFNLHTLEGWYASNSHIVSNCDCGQKPWNGPDEQIIYPDMLEEVHDAVTAEFGGSDREARFIDGKGTVSDYLDLIVTYQHGELGPTLAWRNQKHTILP